MRKSQAWVGHENVYQLRLNVPAKPAPMAKRLSWLQQLARILWPRKKASRATVFFNGIRRRA